MSHNNQGQFDNKFVLVECNVVLKRFGDGEEEEVKRNASEVELNEKLKNCWD